MTGFVKGFLICAVFPLGLFLGFLDIDGDHWIFTANFIWAFVGGFACMKEEG